MARQRSGRVLEIETLEEFDAAVAAGARSMAGWRLQSLDLRDRTSELLSMDPTGALLLGCRLEPAAEEHLRAGALIFPEIPAMPCDPYRSSLYSPAELYAGLSDGSYAQTLDARIYAWAQHRHSARDVESALARTLHDYAIADALDEALRGRPAVGVMGGHAIERGEPAYTEAAALGRGLALAGLTVVTGGGPGAMEAANLGAYLATEAESALPEATALLARAPSFRPSVTAWARAAFDVRDRWPGAGSVGIPTWFYGHEPPNVFASSIAKYFHNALREDVLLHRCNAGIVFLPGAAGTVQEIFQDACENYYATAATVAPMVLVGVEHWTDAVPAWPLLTRLASGRPMAGVLCLVDSGDEAVDILRPRGSPR